VIVALRPIAPEAEMALTHVQNLRGACDRDGNLPGARRGELGMMIEMLEARLQ
jgi:hypothetical protein